jgi:hypothetical protein
MLRIIRRLSPAVAAAVVSAFLAPAVVNAQGGEWVRGYYDFFDNLCYPCTGPLETNEFCTCMVRQADGSQSSATRV